MGYGGINYDNIDAEAVRRQYENIQENQLAEAEKANRPWYESLWDETKNTAEWAANKAGEAYDFVSATASDVVDAYYRLGAEREAFLKRGAELQQQYSPEALAAARATGDYSSQQAAVENAQQQAAETQAATATLARAPFRQATRTLLENFGDTEDDGAFGELIRSVKRSDANIEYFMTDAEKLQKARDIEETTGIKAESIIGDTKAFKQAMDIYDFKKKLDNVGGDPQKIYEEFPELKKILDMDPASAALALHDMDSIRSTHGIIESFNYMLEQGNIRLEYENIMYKVAMGKATENDLQRANDLKWQMDNSKKETPSFIDDPLASIAAGIAGSAPEMWQSIYEGMEDFAITEAAFMQAGAAAGATVGGVGAGPGAAAGAGAGAVKTLIQAIGKSAARRQLVEAGMRSFATGQIAKTGTNMAFKYGMFSGMAKPGMGRRYDEYTSLVDENGNPILTDEEARKKAFLGASIESGIEMMNVGLIKNALAGKPHFNRVVGDIVNDAQTKAVKKEAARNLLKSKAGDTLKIAASESAEEALQSISDDVIHNDIAASTNAKTIKPYSAQDIAARAVASAAMAFPVGLGFGLASATGGTVTGSIRANRAHKSLAQIQTMFGEQARQTMTGTIMMEQLQQAVSESTMSQKSPDIQQKILREQLKGTQFQTSYIDVEMVLKKQNGMNDLKEVAKVAKISNEELQTAVEQKGHILVPSETLAQVKASPDLLDAVSFDAAAPSMARMRETGKAVMEEVEKRTQKAINKQVDLINGIVDKYYPTDDKGRQNANQRDMMTAAIYTNIGNPAEGWKSLRKEQQEQLDAILAPAIKALEEGFGKAGLGEIEDEQGNKKTVYQSENDQWYRDWYEEHKRQPTKQELREMAIAMVSGDPSAPKVLGWVPTNAEEQAAFEANRAEVDKLVQDISILDEIKDKMQGLTGVEMRLTEGLSPEGYDVYRQVYEFLKSVGGSTARQARMGAILTARHADIVAAKISEVRNIKYTALDYMRDTLRFDTKPSEGGLKQMAGVKAQDAPIVDLRRAQEMERNGKTPKEIYDKTGWVKGKDGKWRFEIPDNLDKIRWNGIHDYTSIWQVYDNERLYRAYPWLSSIPVKLVNMEEGNKGRVTGNVYRSIEINRNISDEEKSKTLIHEIQHMIQEKEGFAAGGNIQQVRRQIQGQIESIRQKLTGIPQAEEYIRASREFFAALESGSKENMDKIWEEQSRLEEEIPEATRNEIDNLSVQLDKLENSLQNGSDYFLYMNLAGEQEARSTASRAKYMTEYRRAIQEETKAQLAYEQEVKKQPREMLDKLRELQQLENKIGNGITEEEDDRREQLRQEIDKKMLEAYDNRDDANWMVTDKKEYLNMPMPHNENALVVFGGQEMAMSLHDQQDNIDTFAQTAWHGTPHDFNTFDLGAIGSGEGGQAHGWGLYFAGNREVSAKYKEKLADFHATYQVGRESFTTANNRYFMLDKNGDRVDKYKQFFLDELRRTGNKEAAITALQAKAKDWRKDGYRMEASLFTKGAQWAKNKDVQIVKPTGKLFEVEIPDDDVLLDEQKSFYQQPEKVQKALKNLYDDLIPNKFGTLDEFRNGKNIYNDLLKVFQDSKTASETLNEYGIKGITYEGGQDGRCFVIFDDKAISIIEKYNQQISQQIKGQTQRLLDGKRIVSIMETADESTFMHEMAHVFFYDLEELAMIDETSAKELDAVNNWAEWHKGAAAEYKNTPWAKEFRIREQEIIDAEAHGDHAMAERKKREWKQERFARAFELYLRDGQAPSKGLKEVFRQFKKFLRAIYTAFTGDGGHASTPVQRVMDRMIASEEEIEQASLEDRYNDITEAGGSKLFDESEDKTYKRWYKEAEEESKEQLMKIVMKDLEKARQAEFERRVISEEARKRKELQQEPVYLAEQAVMLSGGNEEIVLEWYPTVDAFREELKNTKPIEDVLAEWMQAYKDKLDEELIESHFSEENVDACMQKPKYREKLEALKATALSKKMSLINSINAKAKTALDSIEDKLSAMPEGIDLTVDKNSDAVKAIMKAINQLRFSSRWTTAEYQHIESMIRANTKEDIRQAIKEFKEMEHQDKANEKAVLEANEGKMQIYKELAKSSILKKNIGDACNYGYYVREQKKQAHRVQQMINAKRWDMALQAQQQQAFAAAMANESRKMQEKVQKMLNKVKRQLTTRTVKLPKEERYWHRHLAYVLRMTNTDANKPESGVPTLDSMFNSMTESLDLQYSPIDILAIASEDENFKGYKSLQYSQFEDAVDALTVLYTTGRDKFRMKTIGGRDIMDVLDEITAGDGVAENVTMHRNLIEEDTGGLGYNEWLGKVPGIGQALAERGQKYLASMLKPEEVLKAIGPAAHKYIFGIYDKARELENQMVQAEMAEMKDMLKDYSDKEKREWTKKKVSFLTKEGKQMLTKENIICMALNMGNPANIQRLCGGFGVTLTEVQQIMEENMSEKDWIFVQKMWNHLHSYWQQTVEVEEKLNGVAMKMVEPVGFTIKTSDGKEITLEGGYYPIKYNPKKSSKAQEQDINKAAMGTMSGAQVLGTNRGFTKARAMIEINRPILLDFDVITEHLDNVIHNIAFRLPARDVYRLVSSNAFENYIRDTLGAPYHTLLKQWATDVWNQPKDSTNLANSTIDEIIGFLRRNSVMSIMGYRVWTAIENVSNLGPAMDALGPVHTLGAISNYYFYYKTNKEILMKSVFMANRINQMDRDISAQEGLFRVGLPVFDIIKRHAYDFLLYTDLMISAPLWVQSYKDVFADKIAEVKKENEENIKTLQEAQNKVDIIKGDINDAEEHARSIEMHLDVRKHGTPEEIEVERKTSPFAVRNTDELRTEAFENRKRATTQRTELYKAENDLNRAMDLDIYSDDEIVKEAENRAVAHADAVIRDTFGSGATIDLSSMQRNKNEMVKLMTTFYSFFNTQFNAIYREYMAGKFGDKDINAIRRWAPFAKKIVYRIILMSLISAVLKMATGTDGSDEKDKYKKIMGPDGKEVKVEIPVAQRFLTLFGKTTLSTATGGFVGVRDASNMAINYLFDGTTYGRSFNPVSSGFRSVEEFGKVFDLMARKGEKDLEIQAKQEKREREWQERLKKLKGKKRAEAIKKHKEEEKYIKPVKRITYSEIGRHAMTGASSLTASYTGISSTLVDSITGTMQYLNDSDGRYDPSWQNIIWSAVFDKKPVERIVPEKPPAPPKKKKNQKK